MMSSKVRNKTLALIGAFAVALIIPTTASAAVGVSVSKAAGLVAGETISITLTGVPTTQGVYVRQCYKPAVGLRDATGLKCNGSLTRVSEMIWATMDGARGSASAASAQSLQVKDAITMYESDGITVKERILCGIADCAVFVHRDHRGLFDTSLDTIVPLTFLGSQSVKTRAAGLPKAETAQAVGASLTLRNASLVTDQKVAVRATSESDKICSVSRGTTTTVIRFLKKGTCSLRLVAKATTSHLRYEGQLTYKVG